MRNPGREADRRRARGEQARYIDSWHDPSDNIPHNWDMIPIGELWRLLNERRPTPQTTIEAVMFAVRARGVAALKEPANVERLLRSDAAAKTEINRRIASLIAAKRIAA